MKPQTYLNTPVKSCFNCAYREGSAPDARCARSGFSCTVSRQYCELSKEHCDAQFSGWVLRPPGAPEERVRWPVLVAYAVALALGFGLGRWSV